MPDESPALPTSRIARWLATGLLILLLIALYFRDGRRLLPLTAPPAGVPVPPPPSGPAAPPPGAPRPCPCPEARPRGRRPSPRRGPDAPTPGAPPPRPPPRDRPRTPHG